jgi:alkanesulfonate monooxygenase SsuD/methylene tetrahydromethanopterin reductase-like flavin-dependent oxidoreductase (luciferase family)
VELGAHLPLIDLGTGYSLRALKNYARAAVDLEYSYLSANDHLLFRRPWLDGPTALAAVVEESGELGLATTIALPVVRGPAQLAKALAAIDVLSDGRLVVGVGPGSSARDYAAVDVPFDERWRRFDAVLPVLRSLLDGSSELGLEPLPSGPPPIWVASWGSAPGIRRAARHGDGWLASAYNITPDGFRTGLDRLRDELRREGKDPESFANGLATAWLCITESATAAEHVLTDVLAPMLNRPVEVLRSLSLPIGPVEVCAERLSAFAAAGVQNLFVWPLEDELKQLELLRDRVVPLL